jgi:signal transduction histidine kinase
MISFSIILSIFAAIAHFPALGLVILLIAVFAELVLAIAVIRSNMKSATNIIFFLLSTFTILWLVVFYLGYLPQFYPYTILLARLGIFFAAPMSSLFFLLAVTLPNNHITLRPVWFWLTIAATALMMGLNISSYAFTDATNVLNGTIHPVPGPGFIPFAILSTIFSLLAILILIKKYITAVGDQKNQFKLVFFGMLIMLVLIIGTVLLPILIFNSGVFLILTPIYTLVFLGMTAYAIVKYGLFNIKAIATEALTVVIWITLFSNVFVAGSAEEIGIDLFIFIATVVLGIILIRSVRREVQQRKELQRLNKQIAEKNAQLEDLSHFKSELLSLASHQIKSPLAAIKGFASLIADGSYGEVGEPVKQTIGKIQHSADDLIRLINTLLDVRKVEEGKMEYKFERVDLAEMIAKMIDLFQPLASAKQLDLSFDFQRKQVWVNADLEKLKQVIQNLVDNAIKYTPSGFVKISLKEEPAAGGAIATLAGAIGTATISVSDSGLGIPADLIPHLFEEFVRDERVKKEIRGTGLGLYIARKIAEAHGGKVWAESPGVGKGSTFSVSVPEIK